MKTTGKNSNHQTAVYEIRLNNKASQIESKLSKVTERPANEMSNWRLTTLKSFTANTFKHDEPAGGTEPETPSHSC